MSTKAERGEGLSHLKWMNFAQAWRSAAWRHVSLVSFERDSSVPGVFVAINYTYVSPDTRYTRTYALAAAIKKRSDVSEIVQGSISDAENVNEHTKTAIYTHRKNIDSLAIT